MVRPEREPERAAPTGRPDRAAVPDTGPVSGSIAATGPERGRVKAAERARAVKAPGTEPRGPGPVSSARFPYPVAGEALAPGQAVGTITAPARDRAPTMGTGTAPVAGPAAVPVVAMALDKVADTGPDRVASMGTVTYTSPGQGPVTPTDPTTTTVPRTVTVTVMVRPPLSPSICGRSSGRF